MGLRAGQVLSHLFAVLVGDDGALGRTRVGTEHDPVFEEAPDDGRSGARRLGQRGGPCLSRSCFCGMDQRRPALLLVQPNTRLSSLEKSKPVGLAVDVEAIVIVRGEKMSSIRPRRQRVRVLTCSLFPYGDLDKIPS